MMFLTAEHGEEAQRIYAIKPMNCPGHVQIFKNGLKSYRDLPFKIAEFGKVHRFEPSGALHGLMRVRAFTQDDAHVFITEGQIAEEALKINDLILTIYQDFGFDDVRIKFSDRPEKRIGDDAVWDKAEAALKQTLEASGRPWTLNKGEGAFYGPKLEYVLRDAIGRDWQCGTVQVDLNLPGRLGAFYIDDHSNKITPVMLHRAMFGSLERFTGILIEHYAGHFPLWLSPVQALVATITSDADDYAREVVHAAQRLGPARRERSAQREDQLQGARALARQGPGAAGGRQEGGGRAPGLDPPARQGRPAGHAARCRAQGAGRGGGGAGCAAGEAGGLTGVCALPMLEPARPPRAMLSSRLRQLHDRRRDSGPGAHEALDRAFEKPLAFAAGQFVGRNLRLGFGQRQARHHQRQRQARMRLTAPAPRSRRQRPG